MSSWSLAGNLNATVSAAECHTGGQDAQTHFLNFLNETPSMDLWSGNHDRDCLWDWTVQVHVEGVLSGNIIDQVVSSSLNLLNAKISVANKQVDFIQGSDHRPITATIIYG